MQRHKASSCDGVWRGVEGGLRVLEGLECRAGSGRDPAVGCRQSDWQELCISSPIDLICVVKDPVDRCEDDLARSDTDN